MLKIYTYHSTIYKYSNNITESTNKIYLYPYNDLKQQVVSQSIKISGNPNIYNYLDNYNNRVGFFTLNEPHKKLEIVFVCVMDSERQRDEPACACTKWQHNAESYLLRRFFM